MTSESMPDNLLKFVDCSLPLSEQSIQELRALKASRDSAAGGRNRQAAMVDDHPSSLAFAAFLDSALAELSRKAIVEHHRLVQEAASGRCAGHRSFRAHSAPPQERPASQGCGAAPFGGGVLQRRPSVSVGSQPESSIQEVPRGAEDGTSSQHCGVTSGTFTDFQQHYGVSSTMAEFGDHSHYMRRIVAQPHRNPSPMPSEQLLTFLDKYGPTQKSASLSDRDRSLSPDLRGVRDPRGCSSERKDASEDDKTLAQRAQLPTQLRRKAGRSLTGRSRLQSSRRESEAGCCKQDPVPLRRQSMPVVPGMIMPTRHAARKATNQSSASNVSSSLLGFRSDHANDNRESKIVSHCDGVFVMLDVWEKARNTSSKQTAGGRCSAGRGTTQQLLTSTDGSEDASPRTSWVMSPSSSRRLVWDALSVLCILYDGIMAPLEFLDLESRAHYVIQWPMRLFWTFDIVATLFTGFSLPNGTEEHSLLKIWRRYAVSWLVPDALIVSLDWIEVVLSFGGATGLPAGWRLLRMMRLLRLLRLKKFLSLMIQRVQSERAALLFGIAQALSAILGLAHAMACIWVGIGRDGDSRGWVAHAARDVDHGGSDSELTNPQTYLLALHWALTNFAGNMEVQPQTWWERFYAIISLAFGFLVASAFVSSITSNLTRLSMLSSRRAGEFKDLNTYLHERGISRSLKSRVLANAQHVIAEQEAHIPEEKVKLLRDISEPLRQELHFEIYSGLLSVHPLFAMMRDRSFDRHDVRQMMKKICHEGINTVLVAENEVIFSAEEVPSDPPQMIFLEKGTLKYRSEDQTLLAPQTVMPGQWVSEHVLWTDWVYQGTLYTASACRLIMLDALVFQQVLTSKAHSGALGIDVSRYASAFVENLNHSRQRLFISDLGCPDTCERTMSRWYALERQTTPLDHRRASVASVQETMREIGSWLGARRPSSASGASSLPPSRSGSKSPTRRLFPWGRTNSTNPTQRSVSPTSVVASEHNDA